MSRSLFNTAKRSLLGFMLSGVGLTSKKPCEFFVAIVSKPLLCTTTLFAAFEVATGKVRAAHKKRRRRKEFLDFMDEIVADYPKARLKVILDNLNTHKKNDEWLKRHPLVTFHFTPTRASWLNQVECWFSILQGQSLNGASFTSVDQVKKHIDAFIKNYNEDAEPFVWTKSKVHQRRVKGRRLSDL